MIGNILMFIGVIFLVLTYFTVKDYFKYLREVRR